MTDVGRLHSGQRAYFEQLVTEYGGVVLRLAESFAADRDEAEDLFQEVWLRVYEKREMYSGEGSFLAWLLTTARHTCVSRYRKQQSSSRALERFVLEGAAAAHGWRAPDPLREMERAEAEEELYRRLVALTERERTAIVLRVVEGRSPEETANLMGCEKATVRSLIRNGVSRLRANAAETGKEIAKEHGGRTG